MSSPPGKQNLVGIRELPYLPSISKQTTASRKARRNEKQRSFYYSYILYRHEKTKHIDSIVRPKTNVIPIYSQRHK